MDEFVNRNKGPGGKEGVEDFTEGIIGGSQSYRRWQNFTQLHRLHFERKRNPTCKLGGKENMWDYYLLVIYRRSLVAHVISPGKFIEGKEGSSAKSWQAKVVLRTLGKYLEQLLWSKRKHFNARISSQESKHTFLLSPTLKCLVSSSLFNSVGVRRKVLYSEFAQY